MKREVQLLATQCMGAPLVKGDLPPLKRPLPITAVYENGEPIRADGCALLDKGKCLAAKPVTDMAPNCLYTPTAESAPQTVPTPTSFDSKSGRKSLIATEELLLNPLSITDPIEDSLFAGYLRLQPEAHRLDVDVDLLATEISNREKMLQTLQLILGPYKDALVTAASKPEYKSRVRSFHDEDEYTYVGSSIRAIKNKGGHVKKTIDKRLENGLIEPLHFDYEFNKSGELSNVSVNFHDTGVKWNPYASTMKIHFAQDEISAVQLVLGNSDRSGDNTKALLQSHGKKDSTLDTFIQSVAPSPLPDGIKLTGRTDLTISFKDLTISLQAPYTKTDSGGKYYEELQYSPQFNRFLKKQDTQGENGLSVQEFLHLSLDVLQILPFTKS